jgi:hypothetical protein
VRIEGLQDVPYLIEPLVDELIPVGDPMREYVRRWSAPFDPIEAAEHLPHLIRERREVLGQQTRFTS